MKLSLLIVPLFIFSSIAQADLIQTFQEECNTVEAKRLIGATGSCRIVVVPKAVERNGVCIGTFMGLIPCVVNYLSSPEVTAIRLTCGLDPKKPSIDQEFKAEAVGFNVATIINKADGKDSVVENNRVYTYVTSQMVKVLLSEQATDIKGSILIDMGDTNTELTEVTCL